MTEAKPAAKGPLVYLDYDQAALDAAYDQRAYAANAEQILARYGSNSDAMRERIGEPERHAYGPTDVEQLDLYRTDKPKAPILVFVHGGAWRSGRATDYGFPAELFTAAGAHYLSLDFVLVQDAGKSLMPMVDQIRRAVVWAYRNAESFGGDPERIYIAGHSSGAHLAGVTLTTDWEEYGVPQTILKGGICVCGMFDLKPVRLSARGNYVAFTDEMEEKLSAIRRLDRLTVPMVVAYGNYETPEFQRQSRDFAAAAKAAGKQIELIVGENYNHFEMMETYASPYGIAGQAALKLMGLSLG